MKATGLIHARPLIEFRHNGELYQREAYTSDTVENALEGSMGFSLHKVDCGDHWRYFYRGREIREPVRYIRGVVWA